MPIKSKKDPISIFVSSTYKDLSAYRNEVEQKLVSMEQAYKGMEYFGSSSDTPLEVCKQKLSECKLMILLIGVSYGSIEPKTGKSYTEIEFDFAEELKIPILCYLADTSSSSLEIPFDAVDTTNKDKLDAFKERIRSSHLVSEFTTTEDLGAKVLHDLPAELEKLSYISSSESKKNISAEVSLDNLRQGAILFEKFWLRPQKLAGKLVPVRVRINRKLGGWKVKDELVRSLGLTVGDTVSTEVTVQLGVGLIDDEGDTDLFADGEAADWLIDVIQSAGSVEGCIIDCYVRFVYSRAPVGGNNKMVNKASLVLTNGIGFVEIDRNYAMTKQSGISTEHGADLMRLLSVLT